MGPNNDASSPASGRQVGIAGPAAGRGDVFFAAVSQANLPMVVTDPRQADNPIVSANAAFLRMTGYGADEVLGRNCRFMQGPGTDSAAIQKIRHAIRERASVTVELVNHRRDGTPFWNALFVSPVFGQDGELLYFFGSQLDVTGQRAAEAALRRAQKLEAVGQLTSGVAHDFNNLLMVIAGNLELLGKAEGAERRERLADRIGQAVSRAQRLTKQLLAFARKQQLDRRTVDLNALVAAMGELARRSLGPHVRLETRLEPDLAPCFADPGQVEVALVNLLLNARDAMPGGGAVTVSTGSVRLGPETPEVASGEVPAGTNVSLVVADAGSGMPPEVLNRATEPFFTTKHGGPGSGLGLSTVYGFAQQSEGHLSLQSRPGRGTVARLLFPCAPSAPEASAPPRGGERVLLVDADAGARDAATALLEGLGYSVVRAASPKEAVALLDGGIAADLLLVDASADRGGRALALQAEDRWPALRVLLVVEPDDEPPATRSGQELATVTKPYDRSDMAFRLREALGREAPARDTGGRSPR
jgi:PAS domain S-box-containing protein